MTDPNLAIVPPLKLFSTGASELMKAALRGISIVFDSGVDGAGGQAARQITGNRTCGRFRPQVSTTQFICDVLFVVVCCLLPELMGCVSASALLLCST